MVTMIDQGTPVVSPGRNAPARARLAGAKIEFVVNGPTTVVPQEALSESRNEAWVESQGAEVSQE